MFAKPTTVAVLVAGILATQVAAFDITCNSNLVLYWGTNSYFNTHGGSPQSGQLVLKEYCASGAVDVVVISFLDELNIGGLPSFDIGWECDTKNSSTFHGSDLLTCPQVASDIQYCQSQGVIVLLSIGGGAGSVSLTGKSDGETFAQTLWDVFGGGSSNTRPFGSVKLDGFDLDIEGGDDSGYVYAFNKLHTLFQGDSSKKYYLSAAPQCVYPGGGFMTNTLPNAWFDLVWPQFYNNYCGLTAPSSYNLGDWDTWATTVSVNKNVKIFIGAPASTSAGGGYVDQSTLGGYISDAVSKYKTFGGVMFWDASQAWHNTIGGSNYGIATKNLLKSKGSCGGGGPKPSPTKSIKSTTAQTTTTTTAKTTTAKTTIITTTATSSTTTATSSSSSTPSSTGLPPCDASNNGVYQCVDPNKTGQYSECIQGQWKNFMCASGTVCVPMGNSLYCGYPS